jgi:hypothetical protein
MADRTDVDVEAEHYFQSTGSRRQATDFRRDRPPLEFGLAVTSLQLGARLTTGLLGQRIAARASSCCLRVKRFLVNQ